VASFELPPTNQFAQLRRGCLCQFAHDPVTDAGEMTCVERAVASNRTQTALRRSHPAAGLYRRGRFVTLHTQEAADAEALLAAASASFTNAYNA